MAADAPAFLHLYSEGFLHEINGREDRQIGTRLQQRGPPISPMAPSAFAVILWERAKGSSARGVDRDRIETNIPLLIPAPQAPQNPQAPAKNI